MKSVDYHKDSGFFIFWSNRNMLALSSKAISALNIDKIKVLNTLRFCMLLVFVLFCRLEVWAQEVPSYQSAAATSELESELARAKREMASRLEELEHLKQEQKAIEQSIEDAQTLFKEAVISGDAAKKTKAADIIRSAEKALPTVEQRISSTQQLYNRAVESYRIERESAKLLEEPAPTYVQKTPLKDAKQKKNQAKQAERGAELAEKKATTLRKKLEILNEQQKRIIKDSDTISEQLDEQNLASEQRNDLLQSRQDLIAKQRELESNIVKVRQELVAAKVEQRIKSDKAAEETAKYKKWQKNILRSFVLMAAVVMLLMLLRKIVSNRVKDPQRRYYLNRSLSILMVFVVLIGLLIIFVRDFAYLVTGVGVAVIGMAIALQEMIASFFAWFLIQGLRGYRVRDWIRIGEHYGEVVDIGLLVTVLAQISAIDTKGETGGRWTGGLTLFSNSIIFKKPLVNYTRGYPFMWCSMTYTVTFESNWKHAEKLILEAAVNKEIVHAARQAAKKIEEMTTNFAIRVRNTKPVVRTRTGGNGVELTLLFLAHPEHRRRLMDKVNRQILEAINRANDVKFAYDTMRVIPTPPVES
jgi:small-conductance mechanosensitive channel